MHPGDQHLPQHDKSGQPNPFTPHMPSITRMSAQEIATMQAKLEKQLGPEYISDRPGAGGIKVHYLEAWKCINLANEIFGFNGWSSSIQNIAVDYMDENRESGRVSLGLSVVVRVTLKDGVYHEDIGYGSIENAKTKAAAFEKCKKEGTTDALKRALRNFGNVLGNCVYDKSYLKEVSKIKVPQPRFDLNQLHRRPEFAPAPQAIAAVAAPVEKLSTVVATDTVVKQLDTTPYNIKANIGKASEEDAFQDQFDDDDFDDYEFEDRPIQPESPRLAEFDCNSLAITPPNFNLPPNNQTTSRQDPQTNQAGTRTTPAQTTETNATSRPPTNVAPGKPFRPANSPHDNPYQAQQPPNNPVPPTNPPPQGQAQGPPPAAGFTRISKEGAPIGPFNPKAGNFSPHVKAATTGIDYAKSSPITRTKVQQKPALGNNADVVNKGGPVPQQGFNQGTRMVGFPPNGQFTPHNVGTHTRAGSGPSNGLKRNSYGQVINGDGGGVVPGRAPNQGMHPQGLAQPDPKRARN